MKNSTTKKPKPARGLSIKLLMGGIVFLLLLVLLTPEITRRKVNFKEGDIAPHDLYALCRFTMPDYKTTEKLRREAMANILPVYNLNIEVIEEKKKAINEFFSRIEAVKAGMEKAEDKKAFTFDEKELKAELKLSSDTIDTLLRHAEAEKVKEESISILHVILSEGVIAKEENLPPGNKIILREKDKDIEKEIEKLFILNELNSFLSQQTKKVYPVKVKLRNSLADIVTAAAVENVSADKFETLRRKEEKSRSIPMQYNWVEKDEVIMRKGEKINNATLAKITAMQDTLSKERQPLRIIGIGLLIIIVITVIIFHLGLLEPAILKNLSYLSAIGLILIVTLLLARFVIIYNFSSLLVPVAAGSMLITILFGPGAGLITALLLSIFIGFINRFDFLFLLAGLSSSAVGIYKVKEARHRSDIIKAGFLAGITGFLVILAWRWTNGGPFKEAFIDSFLGVGNGFICAFLVAGCLPFFEYFLKVTTNIRLLELSDLNHPILKDMALKAPGSFQSSIITGTLAEAAASAIGANALLARVGAYYHDIGKIKKPAYFTENQLQTRNRHERLSSSISGLILISHVKDGVELAKEYKLPRQITDIIQQHHGTTLAFYFYHKALEEKKGNEIEEQNFRYSGPKPQNKEAAIVMLADSVEAASRTLTETSPRGIENLVKKIINNKFIDYQLDECELTLKDLNKIGQSFTHYLTGILHSRVQYPEEKKDSNGIDRQPPEKKETKPD